MAQDLHPAVNAMIGAAAGVGEAIAMQPTVFWKTELQQNRFTMSRALNPRYLYRGVTIQCVSVAPISAVQFAANGAVLDLTRRMRGTQGAPTDAERVCAGLTAGALSALVMTPTDNIMITQQKHGGSIVGTTNRIRSAFGNIGLYRGLTLCAVRESTGTCCYIAAFPMMRREISNRYPETPAAVCSTVAAVATSSLSCLLNHPADTLKTRIQGSMFPHAAEISQPTISTAYRTVQAECDGSATGMARQLYRGLLPRLFRISCGCMILDSIKSGLEDACCS